jgi:hypothetical protein
VSIENHADDDDGSWGKLLTHPPELSGNPTRRDIRKWAGRMEEGVGILLINI